MNLDMLPERLALSDKKRIKGLSLEFLGALPLVALVSALTVVGLLATFA